MDNLIRVTPNKERAKSLLNMVSVRMETIKLLKERSSDEFSSKIIEEYYESILELITAIMSADGLRTRSDLPGSHIATIRYLKEAHDFSEGSIRLIDDLRKKRSRIKYYGAVFSPEYISSRENEIIEVINKLKETVKGFVE